MAKAEWKMWYVINLPDGPEYGWKPKQRLKHYSWAFSGRQALAQTLLGIGLKEHGVKYESELSEEDVWRFRKRMSRRYWGIFPDINRRVKEIGRIPIAEEPVIEEVEEEDPQLWVPVEIPESPKPAYLRKRKRRPPEAKRVWYKQPALIELPEF